jgi:hypothetical protein
MNEQHKTLHALAQQCVTPPYIGDRDAAVRLQAGYVEAFRQAATPEAILSLIEVHEQVSAEAEQLRPVALDPKELRIDAYSSVSHPGWTYQMTAGVRIIHLPTGLEAVSESERSRHANRGKAMAELERMVAASLARAAAVSTRVPAGFYRELLALRELRDATKAYRDRYLLDEIDDVENCVSAQQHEDAKDLDEKLNAALNAVWPGESHQPQAPAVAGSLAPMFEQMTREQLSAWYVENVGYDLGTEDPGMTLDEFRAHCLDMCVAHTAG